MLIAIFIAAWCAHLALIALKSLQVWTYPPGERMARWCEINPLSGTSEMALFTLILLNLRS